MDEALTVLNREVVYAGQWSDLDRRPRAAEAVEMFCYQARK